MTEPESWTDLKDCPFCGAEAAMRFKPRRFVAQCQGAGCGMTSDVWPTEPEAAAQWNRRPVTNECVCPKCGVRHGGVPTDGPPF